MGLSDYILITTFSDRIAIRDVSFSVHHLIIIGAVKLDNLIKLMSVKSHHILFSTTCHFVVVTVTSSG